MWLGALFNVMSQGVGTCTRREAVRALGHGEREVWCGWVVEGVTTNGGKWFSLGQKLQRPRGPVCSQMTYIWIQITNYEGQGGHVYLQMTHTCAQMSSIWKRATLKSVIYHIDLRATPRLDHLEKGLELMWRFSSFLACF